ncbi:ATP-binding protein [Terribacillus sp. JSM ZJ617]|uniref:ATP-binding protein n=1 Tax=Terribacillus sp. JSM ZJ617 TaxID=3342119 RepID=UPI0035A93A42
MIIIMRGFFHKIFHENPNRNEDATPYYQTQLTQLSSYEHFRKRALIGWIVSRFTEAIGFEEREREELIMMVLTNESFNQVEEGIKKELIDLANSAVDWIGANAVIEEEMKTLPPLFSSSKILERVLFEILSEVRNSEKTLKSQKTWQIYRDVIYAATQGKFLLIPKSDVARYRSEKLLCEVNIMERQDLPKARDIAKEAFIKKGLKSSKISSYNLIISEAVTNILKHAEYGKMMIFQNEDNFNVIIEDKGPGFPMSLLPKTTLMSGFSTKESLGQGFTLMMKLANQVILETSEQGSTLILALEVGKD